MSSDIPRYFNEFTVTVTITWVVTIATMYLMGRTGEMWVSAVGIAIATVVWVGAVYTSVNA